MEKHNTTIRFVRISYDWIGFKKSFCQIVENRFDGKNGICIKIVKRREGQMSSFQLLSKSCI